MTQSKPTWRDILHEYSNPARRRQPGEDVGSIASSGIDHVAYELYDKGASREEAVRRLTEYANDKGIMSQKHMISHGTPGAQKHVIPAGATNEMIIQMIADAPE